MGMEEKVVLITGAAGGIGKAAAKKFADSGAKVVICDVVEEAGQATAAELGATFYKVDVTDRQSRAGLGR